MCLQSTPRRDFHSTYLSDGPISTSDQFKLRHVMFHTKQQRLDNLGPKEQKLWRSRFYWKNLPISDGICNTVVWNTLLHAMGHSGLFALGITLPIINKSAPKYKAFVDSLSKQYNYLDNGDIITSTSEFLRMLRELCLFL